MVDIKNEHIKRSQKKYSLAFKLHVVREIERGAQRITGSLRAYGIQSNGTPLNW
jgi:transposase-like protein